MLRLRMMMTLTVVMMKMMTISFNMMEILEAQEQETAARENKSKYRCTKHILTTSTVVECLFSRAKLILCDKHSGMTPHHVEMLLFLYCNKELWREAEVHNKWVVFFI
jgi:hypothetical protein